MKKYFWKSIGRIFKHLEKRAFEASLPCFAGSPRNLTFTSPVHIQNAENIRIGDDCFFGPDSTLVACKTIKAPFAPQEFAGRLTLGNRIWATRSLQLIAAKEIIIGDDVMFAANVFVCDNQHGHSSPDIPYKNQRFDALGAIKIGNGSWIGQNAVIMPGVEIGEQCIVGANSVVTQSIPARSICAGAPARIVRVYDTAQASWVKPKASMQDQHLQGGRL